jgi:hypothetical protein
MYAWVWRHIPFKQWQLKSLASLVLVGAVGALLWYQVFPAVEPILPFDDVQVETTDPAGNPVQEPQPSASTQPSTLPSVRQSGPTTAPTTGKAPQQLPS